MEGEKLEGEPKKLGALNAFAINDGFGTRVIKRKGLKAVVVRRSSSAVLLKQKVKVSWGVGGVKNRSVNPKRQKAEDCM